MKKNLVSLFTLTAIVGLVSLTSCNKEEAGDSQFTATMEACTDIQGKTVLNGTNLNWVSGDQIAIYGTGGNGVYTATPQTPATTAAFTRANGSNVSAPCRAYYPATLTTDGMHITLPATQTYVNGSMNEFPMYAESNTNTLAFRNLCGALKLHLTKANTSITTIAVTAATQINGTFTVNYNSGDPVLTPVSSSATSVTGTTTMLTCATAQAIDNGADFFIYLPAGNYTGLEIELNTDDSRYCIKTANTTIPVTRSQYTTVTLGENDLNFITPLPQGALPGLFSVSSTQQVHFSMGNLQYQASTQTWRFAEHQYDYVGNASYGTVYENGVKCNNSLISDNYTGWIDLLCWGTGNNPTDVSVSNSTFVDWGINAISNGGNQPNAWRTLTSSEWNYLITGRTGASTKYGIACINGIYGIMILPDEWSMPSGITFTPGTSYSCWSNNNLTLSEWVQMQENGAVFLPAAGVRSGLSTTGVGPRNVADLTYWASTPSNVACIGCYYGYFAAVHYDQARYVGRSIRLVMNAEE